MRDPFHPLSRRSFVRVVLSAAAAALAVAGCGGSAPPDAGRIARYLAGLLSHHEAAAVIGGRYVQMEPTVRSLSPEQLALLILKQADMGDPRSLTAGLEEIGQSVMTRVHRDFAEEDVLFVDGWLLARTEVLLCVLVHLQTSADR